MTDDPAHDDDALRRLFSRFDTNGDGLVDEQEVRKLLQSLGDDPSDEVLSLEFAAIDADSDGMVGFEDFKAWWSDSN